METKVCVVCGITFSRKPGWSNPSWRAVRSCSRDCGKHARWLGSRGDAYRRALGASRRAWNEAHPEANVARIAKTAATRGMAYPALNPIGAGRAKAASLVPLDKCADCGAGKTGPRSLHRHHIDGDPTNNVRSNLVVVCVSCHAARHEATGTGTSWRRVALKVCPMCGVAFTPERNRAKLCGLACQRAFMRAGRRYPVAS